MLRVKDNKAAEDFLKRSFELDAANPVTKSTCASLIFPTRQLERARFYYGLLPRGQDAGAGSCVGIAHCTGRGDVRH